MKSLKNLPVEQVEQSLVRRTKKCMRGYRVEVASKLKGIASPSFLSTNLERLRDNPGSDEELELVKNAALTFYVSKYLPALEALYSSP